MGDGPAVRDAAGAAEVMAHRIEALVRTGSGPVIVALDGRSGAAEDLYFDTVMPPEVFDLVLDGG